VALLDWQRVPLVQEDLFLLLEKNLVVVSVDLQQG
jgi:hypothetical protein